MPAPGLILLLSSSSTRIQGIKTFGKVYKNIFPLHCCYKILNFIFVWCHSRQFILLHYSATWRTELADPQALFTFTHPNRGECLKLILLSRRIWTKIYMNLIEMPIDNSRYEVRKFPIRCDSMLHGFAGYFDYCTLDVSPNSCSCLSFTVTPIALRSPERSSVKSGYCTPESRVL